MIRTDPTRRAGVALALLSGVLLALAYPHADLGPLAFVALAPFLLSLGGAPRGAALERGYACGLSFFFVLLYWIPGVMSLYGGLPRPLTWLFLGLLVFYLATYVALFAILVAASWRRFGSLALVAAPIVWVGLEFARSRLLTGFPWGLLGYSQHRDLPLLQAASFGGIYAVSFLVMAANAAVALLLARPAPAGARPAAAALAVLVAGAFAGGGMVLRTNPPGVDGVAVRVAAVQGNVAQARKWDVNAEAQIVADLVRLTRRAAAQGARVVVWPESSSPHSFNRPVRAGGPGAERIAIEPRADYVDEVTGLARELGVTIIAGSVDYRFVDGRLGAFNSAFAIAADGTMGPPYDKIRLVPFGEYVPLRRVLFFVNRMVDGAIAEFRAGSRYAPLPTAAGPAATFVCYEAVFPDLVRRLARGAGFLVNLTNDAWFGRSAAPEQHLAMAAVRAVENHRYLVRAANTGISAFVDPFGRIVARAPVERSTVLVETIGTRRGLTPYARSGDVLAAGCAILTLLQAVALRTLFRRTEA